MLLYIPHLYFIKTRIKSFPGLFYYFFYLLGPALLYLYLQKPELIISNAILFFAAHLGFMAIYELGYWQNDCVSIRNEESPTIRISDNYFCSRRSFVFFFIYRILFFAAILYFIKAYYQSADINAYLAGIIATFVVFFIHNTQKDPSQRIVTFILLTMLRFAIPLTALQIDIKLYIISIALFILPFRILGYLRDKKFISFFSSTLFNIHYFAVFLLFSSFLFYFNNSYFVFLAINFYFLLYHIFIFLVSLGRNRFFKKQSLL